MSQRRLKRELRIAEQKRKQCNDAINVLAHHNYVTLEYVKKVRVAIEARYEADVAKAQVPVSGAHP